MKTFYVWVPGKEGTELMPEHSKSPKQRVRLDMAGRLLRWLYEAGSLKGEALDDAKTKFPESTGSTQLP